MDPRLQEMLDHYEIRKTLSEYCHGCDRGDEKVMASVYTGDDSFDDHPGVKAPGPEYARLMAKSVIENTDAVWHSLGQSLIKVDGDTAGCETFFLAFMRLPEPNGHLGRLNQLAGRFIDRLERIDGVWKIKHRTCVRDTSITLMIDRDDFGTYTDFVTGTRDKNDLTVDLLGIVHQD